MAVGVSRSEVGLGRQRTHVTKTPRLMRLSAGVPSRPKGVEIPTATGVGQPANVYFVSFASFVFFVVYFALNGAGRAKRAASIVPLVCMSFSTIVF